MSTEHAKTSLYLVRRVETLLGPIRFFSDPVGGKERQLQFLAQSDFWEWEMENLIYSFTNFGERSRTWRSGKTALEKLGALGIAVEAKMVRHVRWNKGWHVRHEKERVAPVEMLRGAIEEWNALITIVETKFIAPMRATADRYNVQTRRDLDHLRKTIPALEEIED